jgi:hypothetical protein
LKDDQALDHLSSDLLHTEKPMEVEKNVEIQSENAEIKLENVETQPENVEIQPKNVEIQLEYVEIQPENEEVGNSTTAAEEIILANEVLEVKNESLDMKSDDVEQEKAITELEEIVQSKKVNAEEDSEVQHESADLVDPTTEVENPVFIEGEALPVDQPIENESGIVEAGTSGAEVEVALETLKPGNEDGIEECCKNVEVDKTESQNENEVKDVSSTELKEVMMEFIAIMYFYQLHLIFHYLLNQTYKSFHDL